MYTEWQERDKTTNMACAKKILFFLLLQIFQKLRNRNDIYQNRQNGCPLQVSFMNTIC